MPRSYRISSLYLAAKCTDFGDSMIVSYPRARGGTAGAARLESPSPETQP